MSQAGSNNNSSIPVNVLTTVNTQNTDSGPDGSATVAANALTFAADVNSDNTEQGFHISASGSTITYAITNTILGTATTAGAESVNMTLTDLASTFFPLGGTPALYEFEASIIGIGQNGSVYYKLFSAVSTDGANGHVIPVVQRLISEDDGSDGFDNMTACDANISAVLNNIQFYVTGFVGSPMDWVLYCTYKRVA